MRGAIGDFCQTRFLRLSAIKKAHDCGETRVLSQRLHLHGQCAFDVERARSNCVAERAWLWQVFAGQQRFVDARLAVDDLAVSRQNRARLHQNPLAHTQLAEQDAFALAVAIQAQARGRQQVDQLRSGGSGAFAGAAFQITPGEQKQGEHADRIEVQLADPGDRRPDSGDVSAADRQRHRDVHGQVAGAQITHRTFEERRAAVEHDWRGQKQRDPAQDRVQLGTEVDVEFRPGGHGRHHRLKPQQTGDAELAQGQAILTGQLFAGAVGLIGVSSVTNVAQLGEDLAQRQLCVGPAYVQAMVGQVQPRFGDGGQGAQVFLDQPAAGGATDAFHQQGGFGQIAFVAHEGLLHVGAVVQRQFISQLHRQRFGIGRGFAAMLVVAFQTTGDDGFSHRLTARAAELARLAEDDGGKAAAGRDGQGAVVAGGWAGHQESLCHPQGPLREQARSHRFCEHRRSTVGASLLANARSAGFSFSGLPHPAMAHHPAAVPCHG